MFVSNRDLLSARTEVVADRTVELTFWLEHFFSMDAFLVKIKRAYEKPEKSDGARYLVDRLWPRGLSKTSLRIDGWLKDVAPSDVLRRWFHHDPQQWNEFRRRYFAELDAMPAAWTLLAEALRKGPITLIYGARDTEHNNAAALVEYLEGRRIGHGHQG